MRECGEVVVYIAQTRVWWSGEVKSDYSALRYGQSSAIITQFTGRRDWKVYRDIYAEVTGICLCPCYVVVVPAKLSGSSRRSILPIWKLRQLRGLASFGFLGDWIIHETSPLAIYLDSTIIHTTT